MRNFTSYSLVRNFVGFARNSDGFGRSFDGFARFCHETDLFIISLSWGEPSSLNFVTKCPAFPRVFSSHSQDFVADWSCLRPFSGGFMMISQDCPFLRPVRLSSWVYSFFTKMVIFVTVLFFHENGDFCILERYFRDFSPLAREGLLVIGGVLDGFIYMSP